MSCCKHNGKQGGHKLPHANELTLSILYSLTVINPGLNWNRLNFWKSRYN